MIPMRAPRGKLRTAQGWVDLAVSDPEPEPVAWPTLATTGPRVEPTTVHNGTITTSSDGQVIEDLIINGRVVIQHDNVIVRDCVIFGSNTYMVHIVEHIVHDRDVLNAVVEYCRVDGTDGPQDNALALYAFAGEYLIDHCAFVNINRGMLLRRGGRVQHCYVNNTNGVSGSHRTAIQHHGGQPDHTGIEIVHNSLRCVNTGTSAALSLYADNGVVHDVLVENNILAASGNYLMYGGEDGSSDVRVIDNHWSTLEHPTGGSSGTLNSFDSDGVGNEASGNVMNSTDNPWA